MPSFAPGYILVGRRDFVSDDDFDATLAAQKGSSLGLIHSALRVHKVKVATGKESAAVAALQNNPNVEFAEVDSYVSATLTPNDAKYSSEWHLTKIGASTAWDTTTGSGVVVAVVDAGVQTNHPDLSANMVSGHNVYDGTSTVTDVTGHGTCVAGTIAAVGNNTIGAVGVAFSASIMPIRATDSSGNGTFSSAAAGIMWASDNGAHICNISWSNLYKSSTVIQAAQQAQTATGMITVVSANNNGIDEGSTGSPYLVVVSGTDKNDALATSPYTSSWGQMVDVCAPSVDIVSTLFNSSYNTSPSGAYGTSFATAVVSGVLALIKATRTDFTPTQILDALYQGATDLGGQGYDTKFGYGRVNAADSVAYASAAPAADTTPPVVSITSPSGGATVSAIVGVKVTATDNVAVAKVDFKVAGVIQQTETVTPYIFSWDTTSHANGSVSLTATATDTAGNATTSAGVSVTINNTAPPDTIAPSLSILSPTNGQKVSGNVRITSNAPDASGSVTQVLYIDNVQRYSVGSASLSYSWNTKKVAHGSHVIKITATDSSSNVATQSITVTV